jgi:hypothetical protein
MSLRAKALRKGLRWAGLVGLLVGGCRAKPAPSQPSAADPVESANPSSPAEGPPPLAATTPLTAATTPPLAAGLPPAAAGATVASAGPSSLLRVVEAHGEHGRERVIGLGERLTTGHDGEISLDLRSGARLRLAADSSLWVLEVVPGSVLAMAGGVYATLSPEGSRSGRLPLRLGTAFGSLFVPRAAELWIDQRSSWQQPELKAQSYVALLQGDAELWRWNGDALARTGLGAGQPLPSSTGRLRLALVGSRDRAKHDSAEYLGKGPLQPVLSNATAQLERVLAQAQDAHKHSAALRGKILTAAARRPAPAPRPDAGYAPLAPKLSAALNKAPAPAEVWAEQRELVESAQRRQGLHDLLLLAAEQSLIATLSTCPIAQPASECPALIAWRDHYAARLGAEL